MTGAGAGAGATATTGGKDSIEGERSTVVSYARMLVRPSRYPVILFRQTRIRRRGGVELAIGLADSEAARRSLDEYPYSLVLPVE